MTLAVAATTGVPWADWMIAVAAILVALGVIWRKAVRPVVRVARVLDQVLPVLIDIGQQFHENGGHTLKDSMVRIEAQLKTNSEQVQTTNDQVSDLAVKHEELHTYAHAARHEQAGEITKLVLADRVIAAHLAELSSTVAESVTGVQRIEAAQTVVAGDLAAAVGRADSATGEPGAAADAASRSADESE